MEVVVGSPHKHLQLVGYGGVVETLADKGLELRLCSLWWVVVVVVQ